MYIVYITWMARWSWSTQISKHRKQCVVSAAQIIRKIYINSKNSHIMLDKRGWSAKKVFVLIKFCCRCIHIVLHLGVYLIHRHRAHIAVSVYTRCTEHSIRFYWFLTGFLRLSFYFASRLPFSTSFVVCSLFHVSRSQLLWECIKTAFTPDAEMQRQQLCLLQLATKEHISQQTSDDIMNDNNFFCGIIHIAPLTTTLPKKRNYGKFVVMEISHPMELSEHLFDRANVNDGKTRQDDV